MKEYQDKQKIRKLTHSNLVIGVLFVVFIFLSIGTAKIFAKSMRALVQNREIKRELSALQAKKAGLEQEIARLQTESGAEEEIRKKFNVAKPGEEILVIVNKEEESGESYDNDSGGFWGWVKRIFD